MEGTKSSKVEYLYQQNKRLREQNEDLKDLIKMNKIQLDVLSQNNTHNKYIDVIANYRGQQENLQRKIQQLEMQLEQERSEKFMLEQLHQEGNTELNAREELHWQRVEGLQGLVAQLEEKVSVLEKSQKSYDTITGFVEKNREIFNPTEQAIEFKNNQEQMEQEVHLLKLEAQKGKENEDNLLKVNGILRHKVVALQAKLAMPNKNLGEILDKSLKRLMMYFIETQKRLLTGEESDSEGQEDLELIAPELATYFGEERMRKQRDFGVPHLDLLKIRGTVANGNIKIKEELIKRNHLSQQERLERLEIELQYTRRELTKNIIDLREAIDRRKVLENICDELETRNELLAESNKQMAAKIEKMTRRIREKQSRHELDETLPLNDISTSIRVDNNQIVERKEARGNKPTVTHENEDFESPEEYKIHLKLLAKELQKNKKVQRLQHLRKREEPVEQDWKPGLKRSTSNPFLYFNERRGDIMEVKRDKGHPQDSLRFEHTAIVGNSNIGAGEDLDDIVI